jgi:hypothetical protein
MINFLGVGLDRTGTSTLWRVLAQHPNISFPVREFHQAEVSTYISDPIAHHKCVYWFDWRHFHPKDQIKYESCWDKNGIRGEICATYSKFSDRIFSIYPDIKIILTWRDPVERYLSHLSLLHSQLYTKKFPINVMLHVADPFNQDYENKNQEIINFLHKYNQDTFTDAIENYFLHDEPNPFFGSILEIGHNRQLKEWKSKAKNLLVLPSDTIYNRQQDAVDEVLSFLGAVPMKLENPIHVNSRSKIVLSERTMQKITDYYQK